MPDAVVAEPVAKRHWAGEGAVTALRGVTFGPPERRFGALIGPKGSDKTTLLTMIGALDRPSEGQPVVLGEDIGRFSPREAARLRSERIGFVFQDINLIPMLTAAENIAFPRVDGAVLARRETAHAGGRTPRRRRLDRPGG